VPLRVGPGPQALHEGGAQGKDLTMQGVQHLGLGAADLLLGEPRTQRPLATALDGDE
jgi:hypothetical protein